MKISHIIIGLISLVTSLQATVTIIFESAVIRDELGSPVPVNSVGFIVADTTSNGFPDASSLLGATINVNSIIGTDDQIIGVFSAQDFDPGVGVSRGFTGSINSLAYTGNLNANDPLALYWFPSLTSGATVTAGLRYGTWRSDVVLSDFGSNFAFIAPADGSTGNIFSYDQNIATAAGIPVIAGMPSSAEMSANFTVVPEPSFYAMAASVMVLGVAFLRRRK